MTRDELLRLVCEAENAAVRVAFLRRELGEAELCGTDTDSHRRMWLEAHSESLSAWAALHAAVRGLPDGEL